jgi:hypothetical protein
MADGIANAATAWPVWAALNTKLGMAATYPAAILTFGLAALLVWIIALGLPTAAPVDDQPEDAPVDQTAAYSLT